MTSRLRSVGAGAVLALLYVAVALVTRSVQPEGFRPLFDGFAPPKPYNWVKPPPELASGNQAPTPGEGDVKLGDAGSEVGNVTTGDAQAVASVEVGSVPANPPDTAVRLAVRPVDPAALAPLPPETKAVGNAYQVSLAYQPSGTAVTSLAKPGTLALTASSPGDRLLFSPDGSAWQERPSRPYGDTNGRFAALEATGYYLVTAHSSSGSAGSQDGGGSGGSSGTNRLLLWVIGIVPIVGAVLVLRPPPPLPATPARAGRAAPGKRRPPAKKGRKKRP